MPRLSPAVSGAFRELSYCLANRTLALEILDGVDYDCIFVEASALELVYAIFANVLRSYVDRGYRIEPALESWEIELH